MMLNGMGIKSLGARVGGGICGQKEAAVDGGKECDQSCEVPVNMMTGGNLCRGVRIQEVQ